MEKMCKESLCKSILSCFESEASLAEHDEPQVSDGYIDVPYYLGGLLTQAGSIEFHGKVAIFDDGYYIISDVGKTAAKSAIPELVRFIESLNSHVAYGDMFLEPNAGLVLFRTYERFWDEHTFNPDTFLDSMQTHVETHKRFKDPVYLLIKGASSAASQINKLRERDFI